MPYFTSWDINVFLCFLSLGLPPDLIPVMVIRMKRIHEDYTEEMAREWYCSLDRYKVYIKNFHRPNEAIREVKLAWIWRCPEVRRNAIYRMIIFQDPGFMDRLKYDFNIFTGPHRIDSDWDRPKIGRNHSSEGLWDVWSSQMTRGHANWYNNIHEGRYFLFFRENSITGYGKRKSKNISVSEKVKRFGSIHNIGPYAQVAEDLLVLDGPGLGESGSKIEHIDDLFLD